jgi:hypothetical protein
MAADFTGQWYNQLGSWMNLKVAKGAVTGTYHTAVGAPKPQDTFDLIGTVAEDLISFIVSWKNQAADYQSVTAWVGQMAKDDDGVTDRIEMLWHLALNAPDDEEPAKLWGTVRTGADRFRRNPFPNTDKLVKALKSPGSEPLAIVRRKAK